MRRSPRAHLVALAAALAAGRVFAQSERSPAAAPDAPPAPPPVEPHDRGQAPPAPAAQTPAPSTAPSASEPSATDAGASATAPTTDGSASEPAETTVGEPVVISAGGPAPTRSGAGDTAASPQDTHAASEPEDDRVTLRDGSTVFGHVRELHLGERVVVVLPSGAARTIPWNEIRSAAGPSFREPPPAPLPPPPPRRTRVPTPAHGRPPARDVIDSDRDVDRDDFTRPAPGRVPLHIESAGAPQNVGMTFSVEAVGTGFESSILMRHRDLCRTPCTMYVPPGPFQIHAGGRGVMETTTRVVVPRSGTRVVLYAPSSSVQTTATFFAGAALIGGIGGLTMLGLADALNSADLVYSGFITIGASLLLVIPALVLFGNNSQGVASIAPLSPQREPGTADPPGVLRF